jgi:tRNA threonylcarbamoyl adenosine modification protein (Sua5/YciO/YrdC/YwlC family)
METLRISAVHPEPALIARAVAVLRRGEVVALPTDTVYGLGLPVVGGASPQPLFALKGRDAGKAIPWLVAGSQALEGYGEEVPTYALDLARRHWPGALTLVVRANATAPAAFVAADGSIALRAPAHPITRALIEALGVPLATTSANPQGGEPPSSLAALDERLAVRLALAIDGGPVLGAVGGDGPTPGAIPSTIVSCLEERPRVLREGALPSALLLH